MCSLYSFKYRCGAVTVLWLDVTVMWKLIWHLNLSLTRPEAQRVQCEVTLGLKNQEKKGTN